MTTITFPIEARPAQIALPKPRPWGRALMVSGGVHLVIVLVILFTQPVTVPTTTKTTPTTIDARLYVPPLSVKPDKPTSTAEPHMPKTPKETKVAPKPKDSAAKMATTQKATQAPEISVEINTEKQSDTPTEPTRINPNSRPESPTVKDTQSTLSSARNQRAGSLNLSPKTGAMNFLAEQQEQAIMEESRRAAREFREKKNSPDLVDTRKGKPASIEAPRPTKRVNCSTATNKTLALLSSFAGGTLTCSGSAEHDKFIQARINKEQSK